MTSHSPFSAKPSALGYLFQFRVALRMSLELWVSERPFAVGIELLDDVQFGELSGDVSAVVQTKHHVRSTASLSDSSAELWQTLRVWCSQLHDPVFSRTSALLLVATSTAPDGSAASKLRNLNRDVVRAREALDAVASTSGNRRLRPAFQSYLSLTIAEREQLLHLVTVLDGNDGVDAELVRMRQLLAAAAPAARRESFLQQLEGWWLARVVSQLKGGTASRVSSSEFESAIDDCREQFRRDALPLDRAISAVAASESLAIEHAARVFVQQIELIDVVRRRLLNAVQDYYRAYAQRVKWTEDGSIVAFELTRYERRLREEWERAFDARVDELGASVDEAAKQAIGRQLLSWAEQQPLAIRPGTDEHFLSRGSLHMLADRLEVGWHPDFRSRLVAAVAAAENVA